MKARVLFGVAGFVFVLLALYVFPPAVLSIALTILCALATYELTAATGLVKNRQVVGCCIGCSVILGCVMYRKAEDKLFWIAAIVLTLLIALFAMLLRHHDTTAFQEIAVGLFGGAALPLLLLSLWRIFAMDGGEFLVLLPLVAAWGSDTCALFAGMPSAGISWRRSSARKRPSKARLAAWRAQPSSCCSWCASSTASLTWTSIMALPRSWARPARPSARWATCRSPSSSGRPALRITAISSQGMAACSTALTA